LGGGGASEFICVCCVFVSVSLCVMRVVCG